MEFKSARASVRQKKITAGFSLRYFTGISYRSYNDANMKYIQLVTLSGQKHRNDSHHVHLHWDTGKDII